LLVKVDGNDAGIDVDLEVLDPDRRVIRSDHGEYALVDRLLGHLLARLRIGLVVELEELDPPPLDAALRVRLVDGEAGGIPHVRPGSGLIPGERPLDGDLDRFGRGAPSLSPPQPAAGARRNAAASARRGRMRLRLSAGTQALTRPVALVQGVSGPVAALLGALGSSQREAAARALAEHC
jgi:hypothetical protein